MTPTKTVAKIRMSELKAADDNGKIQRLRKSCDDSAAVMGHAAVLILDPSLTKAHRAALAKELERGAGLLHGVALLNAPEGAK